MIQLPARLVQSSSSLRRWGLVLFVAGWLLGLLLGGAGVWADMEASLFDASLSPEAPLDTMRCPLIMTGPTATVTARIANVADKPRTLLVTAHISDGYMTLLREINDKLQLEPHEQRQLAWMVTSDDVVFGCLALVRVHVLRNAPMPYRNRACGILVLPLPWISGEALVWWVIIASVLLMGLGIALWWLSRPADRRGRTIGYLEGILAVLTLVCMGVGFYELWGIGVAAMILMVLLLGIMPLHLSRI